MLLVSGEPHAGERTWRNLLKSDANVDLVHFTILRPPEKQDGTPINELSLIAFPTRELFQQKIKEFDLIIFDRYANQSVLPSTYFDNIVRYVREGGAVMVAAGPGIRRRRRASPARASSPIIPGTPDGRIVEEPLQGRASPTGGERHPVTREPAGLGADAADLGRVAAHRRRAGPHRLGRHVGRRATSRSWCSPARTRAASRSCSPTTPGCGRAAFSDGGPHLDLLRRLAHWLMKEPALEEEALRARGRRARHPHRAPDHGRETADPVTLSARAAPSAPSRLPRRSPACSRRRRRAASSACTRCARATSSPSSASDRRTRAS